jgi:Xaa-Pro aminopeptidase
MRKNLGKVSEKNVEKYIFSEFKKHNLVKEKGGLIVAVNANSAMPHYFPNEKSKTIQKNNLVLIDIWARENTKDSVFADITWVGYTGKITQEMQKVFDKVIFGRDLVLQYIRKELKKKQLPKTREADRVVRSYFEKSKEHLNFIHKTGHSLGVVSPHGKYFRLSRKSNKLFRVEVPFTIEPGIYWKNKFGVRSEIDAYITVDYKLVVTTAVQEKMVKI